MRAINKAMIEVEILEANERLVKAARLRMQADRLSAGANAVLEKWGAPGPFLSTWQDFYLCDADGCMVAVPKREISGDIALCAKHRTAPAAAVETPPADDLAF